MATKQIIVPNHYPHLEETKMQKATRKWTLRIMRIGLVILLILMLLLTLAFMIYVFRDSPPTAITHPETGYVFPDIKDIKSIQLIATYDIAGKPLPDFDVPEHNWNTVLSCLTPSEYNSYSAKWIGLGVMKIQTQKESCIEVDLFTRGEGLCVFAVESNLDGKRKSYWGGNSGELRKAISDAYSESRK